MAVTTGISSSVESVYAEVQQFYARHMHLLDAGDGEGWALTFTEDGSFAPPSLPEPVVGRDALAEGVNKAAAALTEAGEVHRHLLSMVAVEHGADGELSVRSYAQIIATPRGGSPRLHLMCVCDDVLVRVDGELKVRERRVTRDDRQP
ncbi:MULTISPECIES: nuclear transport factor 2 family protein [Streptomyces]|uniref:Nuclear transport factor 2 family protein n=1 Tax=Streptomyces tsukubensis (strain DSM 42081 / NBRC 108919 / NRRL 18488 / 9993) TaxID=1114943 RepID=A0A7G3UCM9_STRT9|nr:MULTISPECIES: nuclear transport factor 2 family protein [Streptomyces]AZK96232.1 hydroxylacyl-CoA dehydrogenase [Streptomyces tsukubensis]MYS67393.1 nuclear transport factor 2 family protein [Streptomyces sp. SID5473]QKM67758.1 nuclear transport factor 2 family protein [Streptomyces tsukubensis NRRL18488]TAI44153.1 nuclear transport factor 2 family protein [Streptomyces tsukubensis]